MSNQRGNAEINRQNNSSRFQLNRELLDNYLLFIHNAQVQQSNMFTITNTIHNSLYNILSTSLQQEINAENRRLPVRNSLRRGPTIYNMSYPNISDSVLSTPRPHSFSMPNYNFSSPVRVFPSSEQISENTEIMRYGDIEQPTNSQCPIRNEEFNENDHVIRINQCQHIFFLNEFYGWFRDHTRCPVCRHDIREPLNTDSSSNVPSALTDMTLINDLQPMATDISMSTPSVFTHHIDISNTNIGNNTSNNTGNNTETNTSINHDNSTPNSSDISSLANLTQIMARELMVQLQQDVNSDLSNTDLELSLSVASGYPRDNDN